MTNDSTPQPLSDPKYCESECSEDPKHWESECAKDPSYSRCNTIGIRQDLFQLWKARSVCPPVSRSTSTVHPNSWNDCTANPQQMLYSNPSSTELHTRKSKPSGYGGSSECHNHGAWYISCQFHSVLTVPCILFFYSWESQGKIPVKGVVFVTEPP
jgi:hypothetical protein